MPKTEVRLTPRAGAPSGYVTSSYASVIVCSKSAMAAVV